MREQGPPGVGQRHPAADPLEQHRVEGALQLVYPPADRGLGTV
jgi:hypothetical protein